MGPAYPARRLNLLWLRLVLFAIAALLLVSARPGLAGEDLAYGRGLLWQIEKAGAQPSYLFGTMHSADEEVRDLPSPVAEAFAGASSLTLEVVITPSVQARTAQSLLLMDGRTLDQILGRELFERAVTAGRPYGLGPRQLMLFKPWAVMTFLSLPPDELKRQAAGEMPLDQMLQIEAGRRGLALHGLEDADEQIALFNDLSESDQIAMLAAVIALSDQVDALFEELRSAYLARDTERILELARAQQAGVDPGLVRTFTEQLVDRRNDLMVERMQERLAEGGAFIAVGALHLPGERGILRQLEQRGYRVTRRY